MEHQVVYASEAKLYIGSMRDITDLIGACFGSRGLIITEQDVVRSFFDLRTGLAGELFQKAMNYHVRIALVVADPAVYGERFKELAYEHARDNQIRIVQTQAAAEAWLKA